MTTEERQKKIEMAAKAGYERDSTKVYGEWELLSAASKACHLADQEAALLAIGAIPPLPVKTSGEVIAEKAVTLNDRHGRLWFRDTDGSGQVVFDDMHAEILPSVREIVASQINDALAANTTACAERADAVLVSEGWGNPGSRVRTVVRAAILNAPKVAQ